MSPEKEQLLNYTFHKVVNIGMGIDPDNNLEDFFSEKLMIIGTAANEKYTTIDGLRSLIAMQLEQSKGMELSWKRTRVYQDFPANENIAIIVEDMEATIKIASESTQFSIRASAVLEFKNEQWKLIHWHVSKPDMVQSEADTYGIEEWKQKTDKLEKQVAERTAELLEKNRELETAIDDLKLTQTQLIQSEKMASLGELTAGIAHEIQNPLNFVNNFSEINKELLTELTEEIDKGNFDEVKTISGDIITNEEKINQHGKRADSIVKGMLQHSRSSSATKEPVDINKLADEYLRLAYHGLRAKDKSFNATLKTDYDETIGTISAIPQDIGRVILNLITNAFYAVAYAKDSATKSAKASGLSAGVLAEEGKFEPTVTISTKKLPNSVQITVADNGDGIPSKIIDKIFQPFFTTKPTGQGTGLGLSMSYDIVTKGHNGELKVTTKENAGTAFTIILPIN